MKVEFENVKHSLDVTQQEVRKKEKLLENHESSSSSAIAMNASLNDQIAKLKDSISKLEVEIDRMREQDAISQEQYEALIAEKAAYIEDLEGKVNDMDAKLKANEAIISSLEEENSAVRRQVQVMNDDLVDHSKLTTQQLLVEELKSSLEVCNSQIDSFKLANESLKDQNASLQKQLERNKNVLNETVASKDRTIEQLRSLMNNRPSQEDELLNLRISLSTAMEMQVAKDTTILGLMKKIEEYSSAVNNPDNDIKSLLNSKQDEIDVLHQKIKDMEGEYKSRLKKYVTSLSCRPNIAYFDLAGSSKISS